LKRDLPAATAGKRQADEDTEPATTRPRLEPNVAGAGGDRGDDLQEESPTRRRRATDFEVTALMVKAAGGEDITKQVVDMDNSDHDKEMDTEHFMKEVVKDFWAKASDEQAAKDKELKSLWDHGVYEEGDRQQAKKDGYRIINTRWVITPRDGVTKARFVAKDFANFKSVNDVDFYASTPSLMAFRFGLVRAALLKHGLTVADFATAFLNAPLPEDARLAVEPPQEAGLPRDRVWLLRKSLYGLRGAPKHWQDHLANVLENKGFQRLRTDAAVYYYDGAGVPDNSLLLVIHVDDVVATGSRKVREEFFTDIQKEFNMKHITHIDEVGDCVKVLGRMVRKTAGGFAVETAPGYVEDMIKELGLETAKVTATPGVDDKIKEDRELDSYEHRLYRSIVGKALWLAADRVDLMFAAKRLSQKVSAPMLSDMVAAKRVVRYLKASPVAALLFEPGRVQTSW